MDDVDKALEALKVQIKKEIVDNYFAGRVELEEEVQDFREEVAAYQAEYGTLAHHFLAFYQALGSEAAIFGVAKLWGLQEPPLYQDFQVLTPPERERLLAGRSCRGLTAWRRCRNLVLDLYWELTKHLKVLQEKYRKLTIDLQLLNEDIQKFNTSFDFGLIAAQIEAMEGGGEVISGGLLSSEREELSTRMRFKRQRLSEEELPPPPALPPLAEIKGRLLEVLEKSRT